jgi:hypothetical protein
LTPSGVTTVGCSATEDRLDELLDDTLELALDVALAEVLELDTELELELLVLIEDEEIDEVEELVLPLEPDERLEDELDDELDTLVVTELDELDDETTDDIDDDDDDTDPMLLEADVPVPLGTASPPPVQPVSIKRIGAIVKSASLGLQRCFMTRIIADDNDRDNMSQRFQTMSCRQTELPSRQAVNGDHNRQFLNVLGASHCRIKRHLSLFVCCLPYQQIFANPYIRQRSSTRKNSTVKIAKCNLVWAVLRVRRLCGNANGD